MKYPLSRLEAWFVKCPLGSSLCESGDLELLLTTKFRELSKYLSCCLAKSRIWVAGRKHNSSWEISESLKTISFFIVTRSISSSSLKSYSFTYHHMNSFYFFIFFNLSSHDCRIWCKWRWKNWHYDSWERYFFQWLLLGIFMNNKKVLRNFLKFGGQQ